MNESVIPQMGLTRKSLIYIDQGSIAPGGELIEFIIARSGLEDISLRTHARKQRGHMVKTNSPRRLSQLCLRGFCYNKACQ